MTTNTPQVAPAEPLAVTREPQPAGPSGELRAGFVATLPLWLGAAPFGAIYAVSALAAGLSPAQTLAMSRFVFAGAAQFTAAGLFAAGVAPLTIVITTWIINARHLLLAASIAPYVREARPSTKALLAFQLTDESYAIGMRRFLSGQGSVACTGPEGLPHRLHGRQHKAQRAVAWRLCVSAPLR